MYIWVIFLIVAQEIIINTLIHNNLIQINAN